MKYLSKLGSSDLSVKYFHPVILKNFELIRVRACVIQTDVGVYMLAEFECN